jgi:hypothetical protein
MLKKTITYTDYNGVERTGDFYFNLTEAEVVEMEVGINGGYAEMLERIVKAKDGATIMKEFKEFITRSYGIKSPDGIRFEKSKEISEAFMQTEAYSVLFMELCTNAEAAAAFVNGILPSKKPIKVSQ